MCTKGVYWVGITYFRKGGNSNRHIRSQGVGGCQKFAQKSVTYFVIGPLMRIDDSLVNDSLFVRGSIFNG